ncbi:creatininase family protein [Roseomonas sp. GC11]|uniref:creatininase family protein n=1 Tax=Roseomonas sp. GC11 TaxID=2950546 RepID=UPI0021091FB4|nr:creatininase family protein [Roseomonas sp. GC11]MCQ4160388.1 creatininase family protein [Roseomonas sp. GC11]
MRIAEMNWMEAEAQAARDDRCVLPIGSVEQHAYLSLCTDMILAERVATEAAEPLGVPVFPVLPYGMTPGFAAYPGTLSLRMSTYVRVFEDLLESLYRGGFRRITVVNGHGGNSPVATFLTEWMGQRTEAQVKLHDWWRAPATLAKVLATDPEASHGSWMENFPWTRLPGRPAPDGVKPRADLERMARLPPAGRRAVLGDGNFHGRYQRPDEEMLAIWNVAVAETRSVIAEGWG